MVHTFSDATVRDAPEDQKALGKWAVHNHLIQRVGLVNNVMKLLDPLKDTKHLNHVVPLFKLRWLRQMDFTTGQLVDRPPEPVLGGKTSFFVENVAIDGTRTLGT